MIINFKYNQNSNLNLNYKTQIYIFDNFFNDIWNISKTNKYKNIKNKLINNLFIQYKNLEKETNENQVKFSISMDMNFTIENNDKKNKKKIANFKKDNIGILKIHSDCFEDYLKIIIDYVKEKTLLEYYKLEIPNQISNQILNQIPNQILNNILTPDIIYKYLDIFKKKFKINFSKSTEISCIIKVLEKNIFKIKDVLNEFIVQLFKHNKFNLPILLTDGENVLKSFGIQNFLKSHIGEEKFSKYFHTWNNGFLDNSNNIVNNDESNSISLSEYSSKIKYIEPYTSLNLSLKKKIKLITILAKKIMKEHCSINIITGTETTNITNTNAEESNFQNINKSQLELGLELELEKEQSATYSNSSNTKSIIISNSPKIDDNPTNFDIKVEHNLFIPIEYTDKFDIREQDDHLIILIYILLKNFNLNPIIISNDKFKWFENYETLEIKNFKMLYDFDLNEKKIIIDIPYTPPIYKIDTNYYLFPFVNYPILTFELDSLTLSLDNIEIIKKIIEIKPKKISTLDIEKIFKYLFYSSIKKCNDDLINLIDFEKILIFISGYLEYLFDRFNNIDNFLSLNSKEQIFKISVGMEQDKFTKHDIKNYQIFMDNYLIMVEIYLVLKFIVCSSLYYEKIKNLSVIFDYIIEIYDMIDKHIYKIRKLSGSKSNLDKLFKKINKVYIYIRKQGYLKKNIF